jgi:hypothetical protein
MGAMAKASLRKLFLMALLVLARWTDTSAQINFIAGGGYTYQYAPLEPLNYVIRRFNETRSELSKAMPGINALNGPEITAGLGGGSLAVLFTYSSFRAERSGSWTENGIEQTKSLRMQSSQYAMSFGKMPGVGNTFAFGMGIELSLLKTRYFVDDGNRVFTKVSEHLALGASPYVQVYLGLSEHLYFYLKPSYTLDGFFEDFYPINEALNPLTAAQDKLNYSHEGRYNRGGFFAGLVYAIGR